MPKLSALKALRFLILTVKVFNSKSQVYGKTLRITQNRKKWKNEIRRKKFYFSDSSGLIADKLNRIPLK